MFPAGYSGAECASGPARLLHEAGRGTDVHVLPHLQPTAHRPGARDHILQHERESGARLTHLHSVQCTL